MAPEEHLWVACLVASRVHEQDFCVRQSVITFVSLLLVLVLGADESEGAFGAAS